MSAKKKAPSRNPANPQPNQLKGWSAIADFLKIPATTVQRWAKAGMPVKRERCFTTANPDELLAWLGREAGMLQPAHIATNTADLAAELKESIAAAKKGKKATGNRHRQPGTTTPFNHRGHKGHRGKSKAYR